MKKESQNKKVKWLWPVLGLVLLAIVGTVLAFVLPGLGGGKDTGDGRPELYWNLDGAVYMDKTLNTSTREKAEDGFYHIRFAYNGGPVELLVADKQLVNYIDSMEVMGLVFDGDDNVVDAVPVEDIGQEIEAGAFVQKTEGNMIHINSSIVMNGMKKTVEITENVKIYDVTDKAEVPGGEVSVDQLQIMDKIAVYADLEGQITHVYVVSHIRESKIYWRANQFTSGGKTTRVPDENGVYTIPFFCEGERVEFKCKNVVEVNYIDKQSRYSAHFGLVFDDEGYIEEAILTYEGIRGTIRSERYDVTGIDGNNISTTKIIGSNAGTTDAFTITDDVVIYDVSPAAQAEDRQGKPVDSLQIGDRIVCFADAEGNPKVIYISERIVEDAIWCYNITRMYDSTLQQTKREPDADGWYVFEIFSEGKVMNVKTKDKAVATEIDAIGAKVMGLTLNGNEIVNVYTVYSVFGYNHAGQGRYITGITGSIYTCIKSSAPDTAITGIMSPDCKVYNLSGVGTYGEETKLQYGDYIYAYQNPNLEILQIFVMKRLVDYPIYYGVSRMYNSTTKETTREPNENGWYVYEVYRNGKPTTVKTKSKAMATKIDAISPAVMALNVGSDGVVYDAYAAQLATGGYRRAHTYTVVSVNGNVVETSYTSADGTVATRTLTLDEDCETVNMTTLDFGQSTTVRVGDKITAYTDFYEKTVILIVSSRKVDYLYWNQLKLYDDENAVTLREPDADGWYVYTLARSDGKVLTLKTQDKKIADKVDYYGGAFTLNVKDGVITAVGSPSYAKNTNGTSVLNYDVVKIDGRKVTLQYHQEGSSSDGKTQTITLASNAKIFEVGPDAGTFGAATTLKVGDRVRAYKSDTNDTYTYVYIRFRDSRDKGVDGYCDVCKKDVYWTPWVGGSFATAGGHFYLPADIETTYLPCSTGRSKTFPESKVCLDLNGHTYNRVTGRAMYVYANATLNIMDTVGGGTVTSGGIVNGTSGGVLGIAGGTVNLYSGTLRLAEEHNVIYRAGVVYIGKGSDENKTPGTLNMYGGVIEGGEVLSRGGNVDVSGGVFNLYDGIVRDGFVGEGYEDDITCYGGNIAVRGNGTFNMYGGTVSGGEAYKNGGNIYAGTGVTNIYGGTVTGGTTYTSGGGNIYAIEKLHIYGGTIADGVSEVKSGGNLYIVNSSEKTEFSAENCTITGGTAPQAYGGNIYCEVGGTLTNVTLSGGTAKNGGNIYGSRQWVLKNTTITGGEAAESGGNVIAVGQWDLYDVTISNGTSGARGGNIYVNGAKLTLHSGTVSGGTSGTGNSNGGGNIALLGSAVVEIAGGKVVNGNSVNTAGNILVGTGMLKVSGGEITGGTATSSAPDIYAYYSKSNVEITGGKIGTLTYTDAENPIAISGNPVIERLEIAGGKLVALGEMTDGAQIAVAASGVFTTEVADPTVYEGIIVPAIEDGSIYEENGALAMGTGMQDGYCPICETTVNWQTWSGVGASGHYILDGDVELTGEVEIPDGIDMTLDLAGNSITSSARAFKVIGQLTIIDSEGGGEIVGAESGAKSANNGGVVRVSGGTFDLHSGTLRYAGTGTYQGGVLYLEKTATANLIGGTVTDGISNERGGNISVAGTSTLNVSGTTVQNGTANSSNANGGGNIFIVGSSTVNITGGKVIGGHTTKTGGNILVGTGTLNVSGGEISGGSADGYAKNVYVYYSGSNANITGGTIETLYYLDAASFKLSGNPVIGILEIAEGKIVELGQMTQGADVTVAATGIFTTAYAGAQSFIDDGMFKASNPAKVVAVEGNKLTVTDPAEGEDPEIPGDSEKKACPHCDGTEVEWTEWDGASTNGHFYLADHLNAAEQLTVGATDVMVLDLNGFTYSSEGRAFLNDGGVLAIMDSTGTGKLMGKGLNDQHGGVLFVKGGTFELHSGTVALNATHNAVKRGGVLYVDSSATADLLGGVITDGVSTERGGNITAVGASTLNVDGTTVQNGTANSSNANGGGNIFAMGDATVNIKSGKVIDGSTTKTGGNVLVTTGYLNITGGEISGGSAAGLGDDVYLFYSACTATISGGNMESVTYTGSAAFTLSGNPVIGLLDVTPGATFDLGQLTTGAKVRVNGEGVFTNESDHAQEAFNKQYVIAMERRELSLVGKTLSLSAYKADAYCQHCDQTVSWTVWDGEALDGHFYMTADVSLAEQLRPVEGNEFVLDLNGFTLTSAGRAAYSDKADVAILDYLDGGRIVAKGLAAQHGGVFYIKGGSFKLYGGEIALDQTHNGPKRGGVLYVDSSAQVELVGGVITDGVSTERGGNMYIAGSSIVNLSGTIVKNGTSGTDNSNGGGNIFIVGSSTLDMTGGKVVGGNSVNTGGNILVGTGTLKVSGGEIAGGTAAGLGANVYVYYSASNAEITGGKIESVTYTDAASFKLSGNPVIGELNIAEGKTVTLGAMTQGAQVKIAGTGKVAEANANAQTYLDAGYFLPASTDITLTVEDDELTATVA